MATLTTQRRALLRQRLVHYAVRGKPGIVARSIPYGRERRPPRIRARLPALRVRVEGTGSVTPPALGFGMMGVQVEVQGIGSVE